MTPSNVFNSERKYLINRLSAFPLEARNNEREGTTQGNLSRKDTLNKETSLIRTLSAVPNTLSCVQIYL